MVSDEWLWECPIRIADMTMGVFPLARPTNYWGAADKPLWECPISNADKTMGVFPLARPTNY